MGEREEGGKGGGGKGKRGEGGGGGRKGGGEIHINGELQCSHMCQLHFPKPNDEVGAASPSFRTTSNRCKQRNNTLIC
jgi:hypothetical protein